MAVKQVFGSLLGGGGGTSAPLRTTRTVTANTTATATDRLLVDATSGNLAVTLPAASSTVVVETKKIDASVNTVTVTPPSGTIDGSASYVLSTRWQSVTLASDGINWFVV